MNFHAQISWQAQHFVNVHVQIVWQAQYFVNLQLYYAEYLRSWKMRTGDFVVQL